MTAGRPLKFSTPEDLDDKIQAYFTHCDAGETVTELSKRGEVVTYQKRTPYTMEDLALWLDCHYETMLEYGKRDKFSEVLSRARRRIQAQWLRLGLSGDFNPKIAALALAAHNKRYRIQQEVNHVSSTVEGILQRLSGQQAAPQIDHQGDDVPDAEVVE